MTETSADPGVLAAVVRREPVRRPAVIASLALVLAAAAAALYLVSGVDRQLADAARTYEVRRQALELILSLTEAESGQRGYLLTLDSSYLVPYENAISSLDANFDRLVDTLKADAERGPEISSLRPSLDRKRAEMAETIELAQAGRLPDALTILRSDAGRSLMMGISSDIHDFIGREDVRLADRNQGVERYRQGLVIAILAALASATVLSYALFNRTQRQVSELARTRLSLQQQNELLEEHVRGRTAEAEEARARAERERQRVETLLQDTNHRIGNSLATVSSLLGLQMRRSRSAEVRDALSAARSRVQAIASSHRRLRLGADLETTRADEFLSAVVEDIGANTIAGDHKVVFHAEFEPLIINARDATSIGVVMGELVTNALKHAFPEGRGTLWTSLGRTPEGVIALVVRDDGRGYDDGEGESAGLGSMIVRQLAQQFGGEPRYERGEGGGTIVTVTLPGLARES